jgi:hypothetical protein
MSYYNRVHVNLDDFKIFLLILLISLMYATDVLIWASLFFSGRLTLQKFSINKTVKKIQITINIL